MSVTLVKTERRLLAISNYDRKIVNFYRTLEKRYYDATSQQWLFPVALLDNIERFFKAENINYNLKVSKNIATIQRKLESEQFTLTFYLHINSTDFKTLVNVPEAFYDRNIAKLTFPLTQLDKVKEILQIQGYTLADELNKMAAVIDYRPITFFQLIDKPNGDDDDDEIVENAESPKKKVKRDQSNPKKIIKSQNKKILEKL
jgi:hypothetical protein